MICTYYRQCTHFNETISAQVLVAVGAEPRMELAEPSFLEQDPVNGGFLVNTELEARTHLYVVSV